MDALSFRPSCPCLPERTSRSMKTNALALFALTSALATTVNVHAAPGEPEIVLGSVAMDTPAVMHRKLTPLAEYLTAKTGLTVEFKPNLNLKAAVDDIANGVTSISYLTPIAYVDAHDKNPKVIPLAAPLTHGIADFTLVIAVEKDSGIRNVGDLKGKSFAYGDPKALVQKAVVLRSGAKDAEFSKVAHLNHYDNIAKSLLAKEFDAGILKDTKFDEFKPRGLRELFRSKPIPGYVFAANANIGEKNLAKLKKALLDIDKQSAAKLLDGIDSGYTGFTSVTDADYNEIRALVEPLRSKK